MPNNNSFIDVDNAVKKILTFKQNMAIRPNDYAASLVSRLPFTYPTIPASPVNRQSHPVSILSKNKRNSVIESRKHVSFNNDNLAQIMEFIDDTDSKAGRQLYWEMVAQDRLRFHTRILDTSIVISPILHETHRTKVWTNLHKVTFINTPELMFVTPTSSSSYASNYLKTTPKSVSSVPVSNPIGNLRHEEKMDTSDNKRGPQLSSCRCAVGT